MSIKSIATKINEWVAQNDHPISYLPEIRAEIHGKQRFRNLIFSEQTTFEFYAFHHGGRAEIQFNIGDELWDGEDIFRYGLGISLEPNQNVPDPVNHMKSRINAFNKYVADKEGELKGLSIWQHSVEKENGFNPVPVKQIPENWVVNHNFIFIGKYLKKDSGSVSDKEIKGIIKLFDQLLPIYEYVESYPIEERCARICWNTNGWIKPSGRKGKSKSKSHEKTHGYGSEEWLLAIDKEIDGYQYGFLEPIHKNRDTFIGKTFNIALFTIDGGTKKRYWVGKLNNVEVVDYEESSEIMKIYKENGWWDERLDDLSAVGLSIENYQKWQKYQFNVKFRVEELKNIYENPIEIVDFPEILKSSRYTLFHALDNLELPDLIPPNFEIDFNTGNSGAKKLKSSATKTFVQNEVEMPLKHNELSDAFLAYMQKKFGKRIVKRECKVGLKQVDVVRRDGDDFIFYEIKTYNHLLTSLRVALGQLFEYNFYPEKKDAKKMVLVSDLEPDDLFVKYLKHLNRLIKIPIGYIQFSLDENEIILEI